MTISIPTYTVEKQNPRKVFGIRLSEDELRKAESIMEYCGIPDFSKCIRFLIDQGYNSIEAADGTVKHD